MVEDTLRDNNHRGRLEQVGKLDDEAGAGAADMVSMILRGLVIQLTTPDEFRGRMSAVNAMFVISGPMLGQFESGLVAGLLSPSSQSSAAASPVSWLHWPSQPLCQDSCV